MSQAKIAATAEPFWPAHAEAGVDWEAIQLLKFAYSFGGKAIVELKR
jgi:hypothetical protein